MTAAGPDARRLRVALLGRRGMAMTGHMLSTMIEGGIEVSAVILDAKVPSEKDNRIWEERTAGCLPIIDLEPFKSHGVELLDVDDHNGVATLELVRQKGFDLLINAGTPRILKAPLLTAPSLGILNVHPGLLPEFRGATCVEWAIYLDQPVGNTVHFMTEGIDEGPIVAREVCPVSPGEPYVDVRVAIYRRGFALMTGAAAKVMNECISRLGLDPQPPGCLFKPIDPEKMELVRRKLTEGRYRSIATDFLRRKA
jgi:methionyl-tRNA formyltransferase